MRDVSLAHFFVRAGHFDLVFRYIFENQALCFIHNIRHGANTRSSIKSAALNIAVTGMVISQVTIISLPTCQRTFEILSAAPTPMMADPTTCVVLTGPPNNAADRMTLAEAI
jgi:hypothetical protein